MPVNSVRARTLVGVAAALVGLAAASSAWAHAEISPPIAKSKTTQLFTLAVPTEKEGADDDEGRADPPERLRDRLVRARAGWKREVQSTGSGEDTVVQKVTWTGGNVPTGEDAVFRFLGSPARQDVHVQGPADLLGRLGRRLERAGVLGHSRADGRGEVARSAAAAARRSRSSRSSSARAGVALVGGLAWRRVAGAGRWHEARGRIVAASWRQRRWRCPRRPGRTRRCCGPSPSQAASSTRRRRRSR